MLGADDQQHLAVAVELRVRHRLEAQPHAGGQRAGAAGGLVEDRAGRFTREQGDRVLFAPEAAFDVQRFPRTLLLVFPDAAGELSGLSERRHVHLAGPAAAQVADHKLDGAADRCVSAEPLAKDVAGAIDSDLVTDRPVHHDHGGWKIGRGEDAVQIELVRAGSFEGGDHDPQILGPASRHHRVDGDLLHRRGCEVGRHQRHHLGR